VTSQTDADDVALIAGMTFDNVNTVFRSADPSGAPLPVDAVVLSDTTFQRGSVTFVLIVGLAATLAVVEFLYPWIDPRIRTAQRR